MLKKLKMKKQEFFVTFLSLVAFRLGGGPGSPGPPAPGYAYDCNFNAICDIKILYAFCFFALVCISKRHYGFILLDHAKYVILLVKVKIVLNSSCNLKL